MNCPDVERVIVIETHISYVLLTGTYAYKIKKAIDLQFLNFTTLDARRSYCHEELRLNRRVAPSIYLDVVAITRTVAVANPRSKIGVRGSYTENGCTST